MAVTRMTCHRCGVSIDAAFPAPRLASLPSEHQRFIELFILANGNLKQLAEHAGVSYPTVRSRLDKVIDALRHEIEYERKSVGPIRQASRDDRLESEEMARIIKAV